MFGVIAMLLLVGYVVSTRHFRQDMDVTTFMATICPIAALAVLPLAIAHGDVFGMSGTGWTYTLILTFAQRGRGHGLMVFAQKTIQIGTIGDRPGGAAGPRRRVVVPAAGRDWCGAAAGRHPAAIVGLRCVRSCSTNAARGSPRGERCSRRWRVSDLDDPGPVLGQTSGLTERASVRSRSVMKCDAAAMRRSAASQRSVRRGDVAALGGEAGQRVEGEDLDGGVVVARGRRRGSRRGARSAPGTSLRGVERGQQALAERGLLATAGVAVPRGRRLERRPRSARPVRAAAGRGRDGRGRARPGGRRRWPRPCRSRARSVAAPVVVVAGLALGAAEAGHLVGLGLRGSRAAARRPRRGRGGRRRRRSGAWRRASSPSIASRRTCSHGSSTVSQPVLDLVDGLDAARSVAGRDRGAGGEQPVGGLVPRPVEPVVERAAAIGQRERSTELAVVRHDVGEVVAGSVPAGRRRRSRRPARWRRRCGHGRARGDRSRPRSTPRAAARRPGRGRGGVAGRVERGEDPLRAPAVAEHDPGPAEPVDDVERRAAGRGRRSTPARRRCWRARPGRTRGARPGARCARPRWTIRRRRRTRRRARRSARSAVPASVIASSANARMLSSSR